MDIFRCHFNLLTSSVLKEIVRLKSSGVPVVFINLTVFDYCCLLLSNEAQKPIEKTQNLNLGRPLPAPACDGNLQRGFGYFFGVPIRITSENVFSVSTPALQYSETDPFYKSFLEAISDECPLMLRTKVIQFLMTPAHVITH